MAKCFVLRENGAVVAKFSTPQEFETIETDTEDADVMAFDDLLNQHLKGEN